MKFPILENIPDIFGGTFDRLINKMSPGQVHMYYKPATDEYKMGQAERDTLMLNPTLILSFLVKKAILFDKAAEILGLPLQFNPHSLCGACATMLANDSSV